MIGGPIGWPIGGIIVADEARSAEAAITLDGILLSAAATLTLEADASITLDGIGLSFTGALALKAAASVTLDDAALAATGAVALEGALAATLADVALSFTGAVALKAAASVTLDDIAYIIAGGPELSITDTQVLQLPIDYVLAGQQPYKESGREWEIRPRNIRTRGSTPRSGIRALKGGRPSFTTTTNNRGYD